MDLENSFAHKGWMDVDAKALGRVLEQARLSKGIDRYAVATEMGTSYQAVANWENGKNRPTSGKLIALSKFLEFSFQAATNGLYEHQDNPGLGPEDATPAPEQPTLDFGPKDVEVLGVSVGGDDADFYLNGDIVNRVRRPPGIRHAKGVFALNVVGTSMVPRYDPGELIYCQKVPPVPGDYVVVELYPADESAPAGKSFIKRLTKRTGLRIECEQFNPPKSLEFDAGDVKAIYRVIPLRELMG